MTSSNLGISTVGDLMTGDLIALRPVDTVARAREVLVSSGLHVLPIIDRDQTLGVVSLADCERRLMEESLGDVVSGPPLTIGVDASAAEAARLMRSEHINHLLVTEGRSEETVGILSSFDLLALVAG